MLSFIDYKSTVLGLLQRISNKTRAYIYNNNGLQGYLINLTSRMKNKLNIAFVGQSDSGKSTIAGHLLY